jgi:ribosome biogenesis GTPase / thiamine phosphate phosphatase
LQHPASERRWRAREHRLPRVKQRREARREQQAAQAAQPNGQHDLSTVSPEAIRGIIIRAHGLWYEVKLLEGPRRDAVVIATLRGLLKKQRRRTDIVAVGDRVRVVELPDNEAAIEYVEPRTRALVRTARNTRDTEQVILANPDQVLFVFAVRDPEPHLRMLDRFIILAEMQEIPIRIVVNKIELDNPASEHGAELTFGIYREIYPLHFVSARTGEGIPGLREALAGKTSAVAGPSGVGKSSLLNAIDPDHRRDVGVISDATGKGRHTTIGSRLHQIDDDTFVADTPGMRALAMHAIPAERLDWCYVEMRPFLGQCFYPDCTHTHEPDCAVRAAVEVGEIGAERYASYAALRTGDELAG